MKIGYFADGPWSHRAIELIAKADGLEIVFIVLPDMIHKDPILRGWADKLDVPYIPVENVNTGDFLSVMDEHVPDLLVSMSVQSNLEERHYRICSLGLY